MSSNAESQKIPQIMDELGAAARRASAGLANTSAELRNQALVACSDALREGSRSVLEANNRDIGIDADFAIKAVDCDSIHD